MDDHKKSNIENREKRNKSKRAHLRQLQKTITHQNEVIELMSFRHSKLVNDYEELQKRLTLTQKLVPFYIKKFP